MVVNFPPELLKEKRKKKSSSKFDPDKIRII